MEEKRDSRPFQALEGLAGHIADGPAEDQWFGQRGPERSDLLGHP